MPQLSPIMWMIFPVLMVSVMVIWISVMFDFDVVFVDEEGGWNNEGGEGEMSW